MSKKFDIGIDLFKEFLLELGFRYGVDNEYLFSDEYGDTWVYFSGTKETEHSRFYTVLNYANEDKINVAQFVKLLIERKSSIDDMDRAIEQAGEDW